MRFIGSKALLLKEIEKVIKSNIKEAKIFCDIFSGTSTVGRYFKKDYKIISNDLLYFSYVLQRASIGINKQPKFEKIHKYIGIDPIEFLENQDINIENFEHTPFIYKNYSPNEKSERRYFTNENALRIDFIRQTIESWKQNKLINEDEYFYLLAGLIEAIPFVSNIAGTYGAFLKHWDKRAYKKLKLIKLELCNNNEENICYNQDSNQLIKLINGDILYIDPPYNQRQYAPNYHILETVARYDNPNIKGKTGLRPYHDIKSKYCVKKDVLSNFDELISNANFKHIIVSYSTEGIMSVEDIEDTLKKHGKKSTFKLYKIPYRRYKHRPGKVEHDLHELLFYIEKEIK
jgi:adenine-specific DNA-methyltransferase